ncbi:hypothetical protein Thiowin_03191 [Thiorhodovibrio winogradskyi]|uniref:Uncharacterized protein n=1 Tax=Thiorhodovibrio winogradskyi TaxID=77007 RepID=A0ABZ0SDE6_9GAMM
MRFAYPPYKRTFASSTADPSAFVEDQNRE